MFISQIVSNRRSLSLVAFVLAVALLGTAGWGSIREFSGQVAGIFLSESQESGTQISQLREADNPDGRKDWFIYQRMYPFDKIPEGARRRAWQDALALRDNFGPEGAGTTWTSIGPMPTAGAGPGGAVSGRINEIAVSPANNQIILVAGSTGGIWRSTDGGTAFAPVSDSQVDLAVGAIAFAPSNANIVYAGMGDVDNGYFGSGVLKSTDAGATWTRVNNNSLPDKVQSVSIEVDPADPNKVYAAVYNILDPANCPSRPCLGNIGGIYVSTDGGVNWTRTLTGSASDLAIHPTNAQIVYAGLRFGSTNADPRGLFKSTDGGTTWTNVFASPFNADENATKDFRVAVTPASPDRVYIYFGSGDDVAQLRLEMSDDAGATFTNRGVVSNGNTGLDMGQFGYNTYLAASPVDADTVWIGCRDFFRSTDGGVNFTNLNGSFQPPYPNGAFTENQQKVHTDQQSFAFQPGSGTTFYVGNDGGIFKTTDGGATFNTLNSTLSLAQFISLALHPTNAMRSYAGAQDNGTQRRTVGTNGWVEFTQTGDGGKIVLNPLNPGMVFAGGTNGSLLRNTENGTPASQVDIANAATFGATQNPARIEFFAPVATNGVDARIYSGSWQLYICADCDTSDTPMWAAPSAMDLTRGGTDVLTSIAVAKSDNNVIYTGSRDGRAMRSTDNGANWTEIANGLPMRSITNITVSATDPTLVYLTVSGYGSGHVFRSNDSGANWADISNNLPDIPTSAFLIDPQTPATLYAGTDIGVFRSTDTGGNWSPFNNGLPPTPVMAFSAQATGKIQLSTYGRGAYELGAAAPNQRRRSDFDGDGRTDMSVFRPGEGNWYINASTDGFSVINWGISTDTLVPGDYDGDGKADTAVFRPSDTPGTPDFYILNSNGFTFSGAEWGSTGDVPVVGDYDGDRSDDIAVFRDSDATWYILKTGGGIDVTRFGATGDKPIVGDFDGDGKDDPTYYRAGDWVTMGSGGGGTTTIASGGDPADIIAPGDYDGDGKTDVGVFRPSNGTWYINMSGGMGTTYIPFGTAGDIPVPGDYDGDGKEDVAVYRNGAWWVRGSQSGSTTSTAFGLGSDTPIPSRANP